MDIGDYTVNRYILVAVALAAVLVTGFVVQGAGTGNADFRAEQAAAVSHDAADTRLAGSAGGEFESPERLKITTARMDIDVAEVQEAQDDVEALVSSYGGFVTDTSISREFGNRGRIVVRVPEDNLSTFMSEVEGSWKVDSRSKNVHDVTQRHTELSLELKNKRQEMQRLEGLMNRTDDVENLIKIQERMGELRTRIQFLENQLTQLEERIDYATVTITMEEAETFESEFELRRSFTDAYRGVFNSLNLMIVGTGYLLPFAVLLALLYLGKRKWEE